jgi:hypothetical protein
LGLGMAGSNLSFHAMRKLRCNLGMDAPVPADKRLFRPK